MLIVYRDGTGLQVLYLTNIQERLNSTNMAKYAKYVFGTHIWASQKWSGGVYLKRSCSSDTLTLCNYLGKRDLQ